MIVTVLDNKSKPVDIETAPQINEGIKGDMKMWNGEEGYQMIHGTLE